MMIKNRKEKTVKCVVCGRELSGDDSVYFMNDNVRPYCSEDCLIDNLSVITAKEWIERDGKSSVEN